MSTKRILLVVFGSLIALIGLGLTIAGTVGVIAYATGRDSDGFFTTSTERFATPRYALVSEEADLGVDEDPAGPGSLGDLARIRVRAEALTGQPIFVGIGPRDDVERYLAGVAYDEVSDVDFDPIHATYTPHPGNARPAPPDQQTFWAARAAGPGQRSLEWDLEGGQWNLVVMNAEPSVPVVADLQLGVKIKVLLPVAIGLLAGGVVILAIGIVMIVFGARRRRGGEPPAPAQGEAPGASPPRHESPY